MASVGAHGCGFEHQLESVYAALNNIVENAGFLRDDALLAVVFVTNEDDGSAPPTAKIYEDDGATTDRSARTTPSGRRASASPAAIRSRSRHTRSSGGPLAGCVPAPDSPAARSSAREYDVSRYTTLFTQPKKRGGIKRDPTQQRHPRRASTGRRRRCRP